MRTSMEWNKREQRLEGTLLGVQNARSGRGTAYQGELCNGETATVYWTGVLLSTGEAELKLVDTDQRVSGHAAAWKTFGLLADAG